MTLNRVVAVVYLTCFGAMLACSVWLWVRYDHLQLFAWMMVVAGINLALAARFIRRKWNV